ncbi:hypothetical protein CDAR_422991 [Caerostris darwini]|uniref:Uncharacterized protein n=1 Tax=Caerostris darwini TaxID=1538125 RepID=A0AAV4TCQ8_9ARAC|nr:hypothetical protein CDAR_422991 [Caerostris darwini]
MATLSSKSMSTEKLSSFRISDSKGHQAKPNSCAPRNESPILRGGGEVNSFGKQTRKFPNKFGAVHMTTLSSPYQQKSSSFRSKGSSSQAQQLCPSERESHSKKRERETGSRKNHHSLNYEISPGLNALGTAKSGNQFTKGCPRFSQVCLEVGGRAGGAPSFEAKDVGGRGWRRVPHVLRAKGGRKSREVRIRAVAEIAEKLQRRGPTDLIADDFRYQGSLFFPALYTPYPRCISFSLPYPGSRGTFQLGDIFITSHRLWIGFWR